MKNQIVYLFLLLFTYSFSYGQKDFLFYSNAVEIETLEQLLDKSDVSSSSQFISLGDNPSDINEKIGKRYKDHKHYFLIGDQQFLLEHGSDKTSKNRVKKFCPEPSVKHLDDQTVMIFINSSWFMDRELHHQSFNQNCNCFNEIHLLEQIESLLDEYPDHHKIFVAHHGLNSTSELAGHGLQWNNIIPIYGQLYNAYRTHIGRSTDLASKNYHHYSKLLTQLLSSRDKVTFISGHDLLNSYFVASSINHINVNTSSEKNRNRSSSNTIYIDDNPSVLKLYKENNVWQVKYISISDEESFEIKHTASTTHVSSLKNSMVETPTADSYRASERYTDDSKLKNIFMGNGYRAEWSEKIAAPHLDIDTLEGGATPYSLGGGLQTMSLKLKTAKGKKYAFRLLDKRPEKSLSELVRDSYYKNIVVELITTMHPYSPLVADHLIDQTDILHIKPRLYVLKESPLLVDEFALFVGKLGTLEEKPKGKKKNKSGFEGTDDVISSFEMLAELRNSEHNKLDKIAFAKARLMDMFLGDWDRHEDNWKWAVYKKGKNKTYKPIPKDRDHVFSKWTGLVPSVADMVIDNAEDFDYDYKNIRHLNFKARFLDRELGGQLSLDDWISAAEYLKNAISDEAISQAIAKIPIEVRAYHAQELNDKLISRRDQLPDLAIDYYKELNLNVDIVGTNRKDRFTIETIDDKTLSLNIYHKNKNEPFFTRKIETDIIDKIYFFGLGDTDEFIFDLSKKTDCKFHLIGGDGPDIITNQSSFNDLNIEIYDSEKEDIVKSDQGIKIKSPVRHAHYDPYAFNYNWLIPNLGVKSSSGNGTGFLIGATYLVRGFNKPEYASKLYGQAVYYPSLKANAFMLNYTRRHAYKLWDFKAEGIYSNLYDKFPFFYGLGNRTTFNPELRFSENRIDYNIAKVKGGLKKSFYSKSDAEIFIGYEHHNVTNYENSQSLSSETPGLGTFNYFSIENNIKLDFTDNSIYPTDGAQLFLNLASRYSGENDITSNLTSRFTYYKSAHLGLVFTFAGGVSYMRAFGNSSFYHLSNLGSTSQFRGYTKNRFLDQNALLFNKEVRIKLGSIKTPLIKMIVGVHGLWDHGKVWGLENNYSNNSFKESYGGGLFLAPGNENFTISYYMISNDDNELYSKIQLGFDF